MNWENERLESKSEPTKFHHIAPDFKTYFDALYNLAGPSGGKGAEIIPYGDNWDDIVVCAAEIKQRFWQNPGEKSYI
jgi:hypothetical protein